MSLTSKITLASGCVLTLGTIGYVHYKQKIDKDRMHEGVIKDIERQQRRKTENLYYLQQQIDLGKKLRKVQDEELLLHTVLDNPKDSNG